jgi:chromosome partition protein MukF
VSEQQSTRRDPDRAVAEVAARGLSIELGTPDLCFLVALHVRARQAQLASFTEDQLEDVFGHVCDVTGVGGEHRRKRATHAIGRLRLQRMLARIDGLGVVRAPAYTLTRLATAIADYLLEEEILTRESLQVLTRTLGASLAQVLEAARAARTGDAWQTDVVEPLRVTIGDLVAGIERRQRGLDQTQERFQAEIRALLEADWFGAVARCQTLLEETSATLRELGDLLLRDTHGLQEALQDIQDVAAEAGAEEAEAAARRVADELDRIVAWGAARQSVWSEYFQYVHRFLRDVVRLDPARALTQRLREQLAGAAGRSFALTVAASPKIRLLRDAPPPVDDTPVKRPRARRDKEPVAEPARDAQAMFEAQVQEVIDAGAPALSAVTEEIAAMVPGEERYAAAGRVAHAVATLTRPRVARERPWVPVPGDILIEDWTIPKQEDDP